VHPLVREGGFVKFFSPPIRHKLEQSRPTSHMRGYLRTQYREFKSHPLWLRIFLLLPGVTFAVSLISQMIMFPDNPIVHKEGQYVGKYGALHQKADYELFKTMNMVILVSGLTVFVALIFATFRSGTNQSDESSESSSTEQGRKANEPNRLKDAE